MKKIRENCFHFLFLCMIVPSSLLYVIALLRLSFLSRQHFSELLHPITALV